MKGQKLDEAKAGVDQENFGGIPYQEEEYYEYRNWLETYLMDNPNESGLSDEELLAKFRKLNPKSVISPSGSDAIAGDPYQETSDLDEKVL